VVRNVSSAENGRWRRGRNVDWDSGNGGDRKKRKRRRFFSKTKTLPEELKRKGERVKSAGRVQAKMKQEVYVTQAKVKNRKINLLRSIGRPVTPSRIQSKGWSNGLAGTLSGKRPRRVV